MIARGRVLAEIYKILLLIALILIPSFTKTQFIDLTPSNLQSQGEILKERAEVPEDFVLLEGGVTGKEEGLIVINLGERDGVKRGMRLFVYQVTKLIRDEAKNIIGMEYTPTAILKIERVKDETSIASIERASSPIEIGDVVRTR